MITTMRFAFLFSLAIPVLGCSAADKPTNAATSVGIRTFTKSRSTSNRRESLEAASLAFTQSAKEHSAGLRATERIGRIIFALWEYVSERRLRGILSFWTDSDYCQHAGTASRLLDPM